MAFENLEKMLAHPQLAVVDFLQYCGSDSIKEKPRWVSIQPIEMRCHRCSQ
jgi:hypothetical protein